MSEGAQPSSDLRETLIHCALHLLERDGLAKVSLRAVARSAGVSEAAPYTHFSGKSGLMAAVAAHGFHILNRRLTHAPQEQDPLHSLTSLGVIYIRFAEDYPALYRVMFGPSDTLDQDEASYVRESRMSFEHLLKTAALCGAHAPTSDEAQIDAAAAWSLVHGLAMLRLDGRLPINPPDLTRRVAQRLAAGLGKID
ncbi:TetR/AcrR family transcriptional regulator [Woodsholea maritima]|uniref:TetR/AcrR family transcriptional regulator n=1 Tax=Woodsholea maritima TaxID=240237 RepID=UPI0003732F99|nr:TetR/AcrR family transcriptional regulator [Woodsholea maritima]